MDDQSAPKVTLVGRHSASCEGCSQLSAHSCVNYLVVGLYPALKILIRYIDSFPGFRPVHIDIFPMRSGRLCFQLQL